MVTSEVRRLDGVPALFVNGQPVPANAYITYFTKKARYRDFAEAGCRLFSVPVFFASRTIQEIAQLPPFADGVFEKKDAPDFSIADRLFRQILDACPDAMILPRLNLSLPLWWEKEHPDELCDTGFTENRRPCFSSDLWAEQTKEFLGAFLDHVAQSDYRDSVVGYQLAGGNTEEWFSFDQQGSVGNRSREKFAEYCRLHDLSGTDAELYAFLSHTAASRIAEFAAFAKEKLENRLVVGTFYGYTFECPDRKSCHHALSELLSCPDVDFFCSPASYMDNRPTGYDDPCMLPLNSLKLHGKLYFVENDTRTHLTVPINDMPYYTAPVWHPREKAYTIELMKLHYSRALTHGHALWWFDMWGGWYDDDDYRALLADFFRITQDSFEHPAVSRAETALFVDETAYAFLTDEDGLARLLPYRFRRTMGLTGAPYDVYLASDYDEVRDRYAARIFLKTADSPLTARILSEPDENRLTVSTDNANITPEELRGFLRSCGVWLYCERDSVVYVSDRYLFLHTHDDGEYRIRQPEGKRLIPLIGSASPDFPQFLPGKHSFLFEITED